MSEEITPQGTEISIPSYLDLLRRRKTIIIQTFVVILVVGVVLTLMSKPVYRSGGRLLVETRNSNSITQIDPSNPLIGLLTPDSGHDVATQIEVLQGNKPLSEAYLKAGVRPGTVRLDVKQVNMTDVIEYITESSDSSSAYKLALELPKTYRGYVTGNRLDEMGKALQFTTDSLRQEEAKLKTAQGQLETFRVHKKVADVTEALKKDYEKQAEIEKSIRQTEMELASAAANLKRLKELRDAAPKFIDTPLETSNNAAIQAIEDKIALLEADKAGLSPTKTDKSIAVVSLDATIAKWKKRLADTPATVKTTTNAPNPQLSTFAGDIAKAEVTLATKREA